MGRNPRLVYRSQKIGGGGGPHEHAKRNTTRASPSGTKHTERAPTPRTSAHTSPHAHAYATNNPRAHKQYFFTKRPFCGKAPPTPPPARPRRRHGTGRGEGGLSRARACVFINDKNTVTQISFFLMITDKVYFLFIRKESEGERGRQTAHAGGRRKKRGRQPLARVRWGCSGKRSRA